MPSFSKRKKKTRDLRCVLFPEDVRETFVQRGNCETPKVAKSSWERCGDSFLDKPGMEKRHSMRQLQQLAQTSTSARPASGDDDPVHIAWTSSEDEQSDGERLCQLPFAVPKTTRRSRASVRGSRKHERLLCTAADMDEVLHIDSESEPEDAPALKEHISPVAAEISDYSLNSDGDHHTNVGCLESPVQEQRHKSVSEWLRSAQALLQTPPKQPHKPSKTPEDSGKKKRRFESHGLAERLNRLQSRQKSAISFWRHQPVSGMTTEEKPGVLVLHVQDVWEVCGMQAALCQRASERQTCFALFSKETTTQLAPSAGDTIHIHPPWQSLIVDGGCHPIILNTHFSQKVSGGMKRDTFVNSSKVLCLKKTKPYPLTRCLWRREENLKSSQASFPNKRMHGNAGGAFVSLLEALEACGTSGSICGPVELVVQRVYFCSGTQGPQTSLLRHKSLSKCVSGKAQQEHVGRCCLLVQDVYGIFGEVEIRYTCSEEELKDFTEQLLGKDCLLRELKVIQRFTRERCAQLFSLIDSLWPPVLPLRVPGEGSCYQTVKVSAPSFIYRLAGQREHVVPKRESPFYRAPLIQTLREILQEPVSGRCSFRGTLVYKREQDKEDKELVLFVTDSSLQDEQHSGTLLRTLPVHLSPTILIQMSVHRAIAALSPQFRPRLVFQDVVLEQGKVIVSGQSVVHVDAEPSQNHNSSSPPPVLLDQLSPESPSCSLCTVKGVVTGIDENSAFSWPVCSGCGSDSLEVYEDKQDVFLCVACGLVDKACRKMQLEVCLSCPASNQWMVQVKLQQNSILSLLNSTGHAESYEVEAVLGKSVGPLQAYIHVVTRSSTIWMGLEEITV